MNITLTSLEALILKATHESLPCPDAAALEAFCAVLRESADGPQFAAQALAARIQSSNAREALLALTMLDRCMRRCDANFHAEVGKFRFLNEMIKLVSPKYFADRTAVEVQMRVLQLLHAWSIEFPKETKFKVAYDMLKNQGVVKETPPPLPPEDSQMVPRVRVKSAIFEDEEKSKLLQKLLQSKKPEDLQHANRLIKTMVREEERRSEANSRRAQEVSAALDSAGLLRDMLRHARDASHDEEQLIHELHASCARLRPVLQRLAAGDPHAENLSDILNASDVLDEVFERYNAFVNDKKVKAKSGTPPPPPAESNSALLDFAGADVRGHAPPARNDVIDELGDIFSTGSAGNITEPLKPVTLMSNDVELLGNKKDKAEGWNELDSLSKQLLKQSLPDNAKHIENFNGKSSKKIPMNALEKTSPNQETQRLQNGPIFDLDFFTKKAESPPAPAPAPPPPANDDVMVDISSDAPTAAGSNNNDGSPLDDILDLGLPTDNSKGEDPPSSKPSPPAEVPPPLADIAIELSSVRAVARAPLRALDARGLRVRLRLCRERPRADVRVFVVSTTSTNTSPVEDYKFQAVVPKGCKARLLPPSDSSLPAYNPFLPPPALTQLLLVARPQGPQAAGGPEGPKDSGVTLKFALTYVVDDDLCSERGELLLPFDDV